MEYQAGAWSRARRVVLVVLERPGDLLLEHFWRLTSISAAAVPAGELLAHYRQRGTAEGHFGELMEVLAPALSSTPRRKRHYRGSPLPALPTSLDAVARNEALLLLHPMAYELMHAGRRRMEIATRTGWSLRRFRERVLRVGGRVLSTPAASPWSSPRPPPASGPPSGPASSAAPGPAPDATPASKSHHRADRHRHPAGGQFRAAEPRRAMAGSAPAAC